MLRILPTSELLSRKEAAEFLGLQPHTLAMWALQKRDLPYIKIGSRCMYKLADLESYVESHKVEISCN